MELGAFPSVPLWLVPSPRWRIALTYLWRHGRLPDLDAPRLFTELVQYRKLCDRDPRMIPLSHKLTAKAAVAGLLGERWIIPTIWSGATLPECPDWPYPIILKASHGCNQYAICHDKADFDRVRSRASQWTVRPYGLWLDEWAYRDLPRGYIVEPYLGRGDELPIDYKVYVFGGEAAFVQVHIGRNTAHRWILFDRHWNQVSMLSQSPVPPPANLAAMLRGAETIARPFDFARVDFYDIDGSPKFGEVTFYPGSGLDPFDPAALDEQIGALWLAAAAKRSMGEAAAISRRQAA